MSRPVCAIVGAGEGLGRALAARVRGRAFRHRSGFTFPGRQQGGGRGRGLGRPRGEGRLLCRRCQQPETVEQALNDVACEIGEVEVLIYNARGEFARRDPLDMTYAELEEIYRVEVVGAFAAARSVLPAMRKRGAGSVMFSSATAAFRGSATHPLYAIGKFGLRALSQCLAKAYSKDGVHVVHMRLELRSGRAVDARALRRQLRKRRPGRPRCGGANLLVGPHAAKIRLEQRDRDPAPHRELDLLRAGRPIRRCPGIHRRFSDPSHTMINKASCLCGSVTWEIMTEPFQAFNCHCKLCRKAHALLLALTGSCARTSSAGPAPPTPSSTTVRPICCPGLLRHLRLGGALSQRQQRLDRFPRRLSRPRQKIRLQHLHRPQRTMARHHRAVAASRRLPARDRLPAGGRRTPPTRSGRCGARKLHVRRGRVPSHRAVQGGAQLPLLAMPPGPGRGTRNQRTGGDGRGSFRQGRGTPEKLQAAEARFFTQVFCDLCGSKMPRIDPDRGIAIVALGALDDDPGMKAADHIFVADKCEWHDITDDLPVFEEGPAAV